jgi:hypothetical protein
LRVYHMTLFYKALLQWLHDWHYNNLRHL